MIQKHSPTNIHMTTKPIIMFDAETLAYTNNAEYRAALRRFFQMNPHINTCAPDCPTGNLDSETIDELMYDTEATMRGINAIYDATKGNPMFMNLYLRAAGRIFSEDATMGLTLLFCYDHFAGFVPVLADHWNMKTGEVLEGDVSAKYQALYDNI